MGGRWLPEPQRLPYRRGPMAERARKGGSGGRPGDGNARVTVQNTSMTLPPIKKIPDHCHPMAWGGWGVVFGMQPKKDIESAVRLGFEQLPICMAKTPCRSRTTQHSKDSHPDSPCPFQGLRILSGRVSHGCVCSGIPLMPGLPKKAGERIDIDPRSGEIVGSCQFSLRCGKRKRKSGRRE